MSILCRPDRPSPARRTLPRPPRLARPPRSKSQNTGGTSHLRYVPLSSSPSAPRGRADPSRPILTQFSVPSSYYGLSTATPLIPSNCSLTQIHLYFRHGARYPTTGAPPSLFAEKLQNASSSGQWKAAKGDLEFLNDWTYKLGAELLTPFGRKQNFDFGVLARQVRSLTFPLPFL